MKIKKILIPIFLIILSAGLFIIGRADHVESAEVKGWGLELSLSDLKKEGDYLVYDLKEDYLAYSFKWNKKGSFEYSLDGENFQTPVINEDIPVKDSSNLVSTDLAFDIENTSSIFFKNVTTKSLTISLIRAVPNKVGATGLKTPASYPTTGVLDIVTRKEWGANESLSDWDPSYYPVDKFIIHHTVTGGQVYIDVVRAIYYYHTVTLGWGDIGYNYLIDKNGTIYEGRKGGEGVIGAHAYNENASSIGISFVGDYSYKVPPKAALESFRKLLTEKSIIHDIDQLTWQGNVFGHRNMPENRTKCPGQYFYDRLGPIISEANTELQNTISENPEILQKRNEMESFMNGYEDVRLKLTFADTNITETEIKNFLKEYWLDGDSIMEINSNEVILNLEDWSYYWKEWMDVSESRRDNLYFWWSMRDEVSQMQKLTNPYLFRYDPRNTIKRDNLLPLTISFSEPVTCNNIDLIIRRKSDSLLVGNVNLNNTTCRSYDRNVEVLTLENTPLRGVTEYTIEIQSNTFIDKDGNTQENTVNNWEFILDQWTTWRKEGGILGEVEYEEFNGDLFQAMRSWNRRLYTRYYDLSEESWTPWVMNGGVLSNVEMEVYDGSLYQSMRSWNDHLYYRSFNGTSWSSWTMDRGMRGNVEMITYDNKLYQSIRGEDRREYTRYYDGNSWSEWKGGGGMDSNMKMIEYNGKLYQSMRSWNNNPYFRNFDGSDWSSWKRSDIKIEGDVDMEVYNGKLYQSVRGVDQRQYIRFFDGNNWSEWEKSGGMLSNSEMEVYDEKLYQAMRSWNNRMYLRYFDGTVWSSWEMKREMQGDARMVNYNNNLYQSVSDWYDYLFTRDLDINF